MQESLSCIRWRCPVDVVVTPARAAQDTWLLSDRLSRHLGKIYQAPGGFFISPASDSALEGVPLASHASLDAAMSAIENHTKGACQLSRGNEG
jgi:hypothetical protein